MITAFITEAPTDPPITDSPQPTVQVPEFPCWPAVTYDDFDGELNVTTSGRVCQMWSEDTPHVSSELDDYHNYCRFFDMSRFFEYLFRF